MSCIEITPPCMPTISVTWVTRREPSCSRDRCTSRLMPEAICSRIALIGSSTAMSTMFSIRDRASRGELAWIVVNDPSWPVFIACSMSKASPPRHSPTMIRSGRIRSAFLTRSRCRTWPLPSMLGGRVSRLTQSSCLTCSSAGSSIVTIRSLGGINADSKLSSVVLPVPVPPATRMLARARTHALRKSSVDRPSVPSRTRSSAASSSRENFRIVSEGP